MSGIERALQMLKIAFRAVEVTFNRRIVWETTVSLDNLVRYVFCKYDKNRIIILTFFFIFEILNLYENAFIYFCIKITFKSFFLQNNVIEFV